MTKVRRFVAVIAFLGLAAYISSSLQGQSGKKNAPAAPVTTPQAAAAKQVSQLAEATKSRFSLPGIITYRPLKGGVYFALQLQPKLEAAPARPRDIAIVMSTAATQAGPSWIAGAQIAEGIMDAAKATDRVSLWSVNMPKFTKNLTKDFLAPKDAADNIRLRDALKQYRTKEFPGGSTDLKNALAEVIKSFSDAADRQRIILFLGDGLSTANAMTEEDRLGFARQMVEREIAFFPVPLGVQLNPNTLHGLANSTGGVVLRTRVDEEKLTDVLKRYEEAFKGTILYNVKLALPAAVTSAYPTVVPPLRSDSPTLVVGRMNGVPKQIDFTLTGRVAGKNATIKASEKVLAPDLENYFLVTMIDQWAKAKDYPAVLRADRALSFTYEQTRLQRDEYLEAAELAMQDGHAEAAGRLFRDVRALAPHDAQADAGLKIVERMKDGSLNKEVIRKQLENRVSKLERVKNDKVDWDVVLAKANDDFQDDPVAKKPADAKQPAIGPEQLLKEFRDRQAIEAQKVSMAVDDAIRQAGRTVKNDPDGTLDLLRNLMGRVKDHPDLNAQMRNALGTRLQQALRDTAREVQVNRLRKAEQANLVSVAEKNLIREQERKSFEDRVDAQFRIYKNLMAEARFEERTKYDVLQAMVQIQDEARQKGQHVPIATKAMYDEAMAAAPLREHNAYIREREDKWLAILMSIEKSHIPYPDEPNMHFPPLKTWKAIIKARKDKYEVSSLPDDEQGRIEATGIYRELQKTIDTKGLQEPIKLKTALIYFSDFFKGKLPILLDKEAFLTDAPDAGDPYDADVSLPAGIDKMVMNTALRLILAQVGKGNATYLIRRSFIEITTTKRYFEDKVIRIYPVGDLAMPINGGVQGGAAGMPQSGTPQAGMPQAGMPMAGMPMAGMPMGGGMGMPMMGGGMGMPMMGGGMGMPMMGGGMGMPMMGGGMGMPMMGGGMGMPMMGGGGMGMPMMGGGGMGMPMMGGGGMGMPMMGGGGFGAPIAGSGSFQGSFNGSLGAVGATQAAGLISIITRIVDPGNWNAPNLTPMMGFGMMGFMGFRPIMGGFPMGGFMMGMPMGGFMMGMPMVGMNMGPMMMGMGMAGLPDPLSPQDPQSANSIDFFPPALALIIRGPSRMHTSITGGIVGGRAKRLEAAAFLELDKGQIAQADRDPQGKVLAERGRDNDPKMAKKEAIDPAKIWQDAFDKGGIDTAQVIATADFLFENGQFKHAAEFLKANLRHGVAVRPWVFEALAVALESDNGDPDEIRRVRLSGIALDPTDPQGFLSAARAMADRGDHARALAFCKQAAVLEPTDYHSYEIALAYAEDAKDVKGMEWAVSNLVSQDWPVDNLLIQKQAQKRVASLAAALKTEKRGAEASQIEAALARLNQRDLIVQLVWENTGGPAELEMKVKEPSGSVCNLDQKQSPGGGIMIGYNLIDKTPTSQYIVSQAFPGAYEITVSRVYGQPLGNKARLIITTNAGTKKQTLDLKTVSLDKDVTFKITLKEGRRTELATVSAAAQVRHEVRAERESSNAFNELRSIANPGLFNSSGVRGGTSSGGGSVPTVASMAAKDSQNRNSTTVMQNALPPSGGGVQMTAQVRLSADQRNLDMVIRPFFDAAAMRAGRPPVNLSAIPGGGN